MKRGDTLSGIAFATINGRIYGQEGSLQKVLALNPQVRNPNKIYPGEKILLQEIPEVSEEPELPKKKSYKSSVEALFYANSLKIEGHDSLTSTNGNLYSDNSYGVELRWNQDWNTKWKSSLLLNVNQISFRKPDNRELTNQNNTLLKIGAGAKYALTSDFSIYDEVIYGDELFMRAENESSVRLDKGRAFSNRLGLSYKLINSESLIIENFAGVSSIFGTSVENYETETGHGYHLGAMASNRLFKGILEYQALDKNTSRIEQTHTDLKIFFGMEWKLY